MRDVMLLCSTMALLGCGGGDKHYEIAFSAVVGGARFACGQSYAGIGTSGATIQPQDLRFYVHDVALVKGATSQPLVLDADSWQLDRVALLDFEDGTGGCATESPETHTVVTGTAPDSDYSGISFTLGVPQDHDHLDVLKAAAPLNQPALFWSWVGGYKYAKVEVGAEKNASWFFHLGAQTCSAASQASIVCKYPNLASVALDGYTPGVSKVQFDLAALYAGSDLNVQVDGMTDNTPGCMSFEGDPECPALFSRLGLAFEGQGAPPAQTVFTAR